MDLGGLFFPCSTILAGTCFRLVKRNHDRQSGHYGSLRKSGFVCVSTSDGRPSDNDEKIDLKMEPNTKRAARKAVATVLQVDRARLADVDSISKKSARLLPRAVLEALTDRIRARQWQSALKVFELLRLQEWYEPKEEIYIKLLRMLGKCKLPDEAAALFEVMTVEDKMVPSLQALTTLLYVYMNSQSRLREAFALFEHMQKVPGYEPDVHVYSLMIKGCCEGGLFDRASQLLMEMWDSGVEPNVVTYNTLIDAFGNVGMLSHMEHLFSHVLESGTCEPDSWTWNIMMKHYGNRGDIQKMEHFFGLLQEGGVQPDIVTFNTLVKAYGRNGFFEKMKSVVIYMRKYRYPVDVTTFNLMIEAYGKGAMVQEMEGTFSAMKRAGVKFTAFTLCCLISAYSKKQMWDCVEKVKRQWKNSDLVPDVVLYNSLIHAYRRAGNLEEMHATFEEMNSKGLKPDEITYTTLIEGFKSRHLEDKVAQLSGELKALQYRKAR